MYRGGGMEDASRPTMVASAIKYIIVIQYIKLHSYNSDMVIMI
jgi:hypothetical protein